MRLFGKVDGSLNRFDRGAWLTEPFDALMVALAGATVVRRGPSAVDTQVRRGPSSSDTHVRRGPSSGDDVIRRGPS